MYCFIDDDEQTLKTRSIISLLFLYWLALIHIFLVVLEYSLLSLPFQDFVVNVSRYLLLLCSSCCLPASRLLLTKKEGEREHLSLFCPCFRAEGLDDHLCICFDSSENKLIEGSRHYKTIDSLLDKTWRTDSSEFNL